MLRRSVTVACSDDPFIANLVEAGAEAIFDCCAAFANGPIQQKGLQYVHSHKALYVSCLPERCPRRILMVFHNRGLLAPRTLEMRRIVDEVLVLHIIAEGGRLDDSTFSSFSERFPALGDDALRLLLRDAMSTCGPSTGKPMEVKSVCFVHDHIDSLFPRSKIIPAKQVVDTSGDFKSTLVFPPSPSPWLDTFAEITLISLRRFREWLETQRQDQVLAKQRDILWLAMLAYQTKLYSWSATKSVTLYGVCRATLDDAVIGYVWRSIAATSYDESEHTSGVAVQLLPALPSTA